MPLLSYELFDIDPFWVPRTEEELEDLGVLGERENVAKRYMDAVRSRKVSGTTQAVLPAVQDAAAALTADAASHVLPARACTSTSASSKWRRSSGR